MKEPLILASASERRKKILSDLDVSFDVVIPDVAEVFYEDDPQQCAAENSARKNEWCRIEHPGFHIISADTIVDFEGRSIVKPSSMAEAVTYLELFSGKQQDVVTAVTFSSPGYGVRTEIVRSSVTFKTLSESGIRDYFSQVDPFDKAGAYDIDQLGNLIIESFSGSRTNIMGLPRETITQWLDE